MTEYCLEADVALKFAPERGLPARDFQLLGIKLGVRHNFLIGRHIFGPQLELSLFTFSRRGKAVHCKAQVGQNLIIDDIVVDYGVGVEGILRQNTAVFVRAILTNGLIPKGAEALL